MEDNNLDALITVKTFTYSQEAAIIHAFLESEGIECYLKDELTAQINPFYSNAIGGIKLQVKKSDYSKAAEILNASESNKQNQEASVKTELLPNDNNEIRCPICGSTEVSKPRTSTRALAISCLLLGFPLLFIDKYRHCFDCGHDFKKTKPSRQLK